jgi:hypothetical protein
MTDSSLIEQYGNGDDINTYRSWLLCKLLFLLMLLLCHRENDFWCHRWALSLGVVNGHRCIIPVLYLAVILDANTALVVATCCYYC